MRLLPPARPAYLGLFIGLLGLLLVCPGFGQTPPAAPTAAAAVRPFTGAVFSRAGLPLPGATVTVVGPRQIPAIANADGYFLLQLPAGVPVAFVVAYPGFASQQIELRAPEAEKNLVVTLAPLVPEAGAPVRRRRGARRTE